MRDKLATGFLVLALVSVAILFLRGIHLQLEHHTYESDDDEEVPVIQVNIPPTKDCKIKNSHGIEADKTTTLTEEVQQPKAMEKNHSEGHN